MPRPPRPRPAGAPAGGELCGTPAATIADPSSTTARKTIRRIRDLLPPDGFFGYHAPTALGVGALDRTISSIDAHNTDRCCRGIEWASVKGERSVGICEE